MPVIRAVRSKDRNTIEDLGPAAPNFLQLGMIGDSLTAQMASLGIVLPAMHTLGWDYPDTFYGDGLFGRGITHPIGGSLVTPSPYTEDVIDTMRGLGFDPRVWFIALGTNNQGDGSTYWDTAIQAILDKINSGPNHNYTIYWVSTGYLLPGQYNQVAFLAKLNAFAAANPNMRVLDYEAYLVTKRSDPSWASWWDDDIHQTTAGYNQLRLPFYVQALSAGPSGV